MAARAPFCACQAGPNQTPTAASQTGLHAEYHPSLQGVQAHVHVPDYDCYANPLDCEAHLRLLPQEGLRQRGQHRQAGRWAAKGLMTPQQQPQR